MIRIRIVTMTQEDIRYYQQRAEAELKSAHKASRPEVVTAHFRLAEAYLERIAAASQHGQADD